MPYSMEINRNNPTCFLFVIDQSGSMDEEMDGGAIKSQFVGLCLESGGNLRMA